MLQLPIAFDSRRWSAGGFYDEERVAERILFWDFVTFPPFGNHRGGLGSWLGCYVRCIYLSDV